MEKKLLAILGSPQKNGAIAKMLQLAKKTAEEKGWHVDFVDLYEKNIGYCKGCSACMKTHNCVIQDDIQEISELLRACDLVILAAPVYWANVRKTALFSFNSMQYTGTIFCNFWSKHRCIEKYEGIL